MKAKDWVRVRRQFLKQHPPNHEGYWICTYGCWTVSPEVDHIQKRSTHPHLVVDFSNLQILCPLHHQEKHK